ncbi:MAG: hypothetical protein BGP24_11795 [Lysobacterales bacterium 69-70]|nr:hypothetical protein [Xanthomonadaceae bacterium]ODU30895.1 MAG: hypothetical protein ABS97_21560 [Xanthomonadaceae bacterium SCN 69-320]ODV22220.1 MAG: hypothetical protein ABT27_02940 [Xanthomonadaceae bacterium SCN 69-25]OJY98481.1 MAG: hypothetical protein BGP24_11795 [Xanthomonadales bacterium 69-70]
MSALAWLDFDEAERSRMQQLIALFQEQETRDELGMGSVRDFISDQLFPGTSTIQTRLRYMLFVPWILRSLESRSGTSQQLKEDGRRLELRLIAALCKGQEQAGVIGATVGDGLQRLPSSIYWPGLAHWGIRQFEGALESYFESLAFLRERRGGQQREDSSPVSFWHAALPAPPPGYLDECSFRLTAEEAQFIIDRLVATHPDCLLTWLARNGDAGMADAIWMHPSFDAFTARHQALVRHAQQFSDVMHGAALVYNLLLSERRQDSVLTDAYLQDLAEWADGLDSAAVRAWQPEELFAQMAQAGVAARPPLRKFVLAWKQAVEADPGRVAGDSDARQLVEGRERQMKGNQSRFVNSARLSAWNGASGTQPLSYRWYRAQSHLQDLANAR